MDWLPQLAINAPIGAAVYLIVRLFLEHIASERAKDREMWENHLSKVTDTLGRLADEVRDFRRGA